MNKKRFKGKRASGSLSRIQSESHAHEVLELEIESLVFGGSGLARTDKGVVFVDFAAPGDRLRVEIIENKKDYRRGRILEILKPSELRQKAPCPLFTKCGGCDWQHLSYDYQAETKEALLKNFVERKKIAVAEFLPIERSPQAWNYRNRIQVQVDDQGAYYFAKRSHKSVYVKDCLIAEDRINSQLKTLKSKDPKRVQITHQGVAESIGELFAHEFSQVNTAQNEKLVARVLDWAKDLDIQNFYDLYAGSGNFSFPLLNARPNLRGYGVELNPKSVRWAQDEAEKLKIKRTQLEFLCGSVDHCLPRLEIPQKSLILLDPPRDGISEVVVRQLASLNAARILYISCNPATMVRDLERLTSSSGWKVQRMQAFDMFPQTSHIEVLAELKIDSQD